MTHPLSLVRSRACRLVLAAVVAVAVATPALAAPGDRSADGVWRSPPANTLASGTLNYEFASPDDYRVVELDDLALFRVLREAPLEFTAAARTSAPTLTLPMPDGSFARFRIVESPVLSPKLASENPDIKTYVAQGIDDPTHTARFIRGPIGFRALIVTPGDLVLIEPDRTVAGDNLYLSYHRKALPPPDGMSCEVNETSGTQIDRVLAPPSGANLRTYNMALVATAEFRNTWGTAQATTDAMTGYITLVNALYEAEVAIRFNVVCTSVGYTNAGTDPFTDPETVDGTLLDEADAALDADCPGGYQVGHLIHHRAGGGNSFSGRAAISSVCQGNAGRAASTGTNVNSTLWVVDLLPHEIGHQFSAQHTYNSTAGGCVERQGGSAYEIGSGTTIMSYACAGCTGEDANGNGCADGYFHTHSFDQITNYREAGGNCGAQTATGNTAPNVGAGPDRTIPQGTPFTLTTTGTDPDGDALTWCWEQYDLGAASPPLGGGNGPLFRSFLPTTSRSRTFPNMAAVLAGTATPFEILPTSNRTMTFRATARDNKAGGGGVNYDTIVLTVSGDPFVLNYPNGGQSLRSGCTINVQWTVGGGSVAPNVNILFSQDGGQTFPTTLAANVPNDGSHDVVLPCVTSTQTDARIMIAAVDNYFFDVSNSNFTVSAEAPVASIKAPTEVYVDAGCSVTIPVEGVVTDDCAVSVGDVQLTATALGNTATVVSNLVAAQNGAGQVTISGSVTVSDLTSCPAIIRIQVDAADGCNLEASDFADVAVLDQIAPVVATSAVGGEVGATCEYLLPFSATITDNCAIHPSDVHVVVTNPSNNATVDIPQWVTDQVSATELQVEGTVLVSDLTSCPAVIRVEVQIEDQCTNPGSHAVEVEVVDVTPPEIAVTLNRYYLWPPNHKLVDIVADVQVSDNCPDPSFVLTSITSNEPDDDIGDGNTEPDIVGADLGTPDVNFQLRSERMGPRTGRVYTIVYTASDNCGNSTDAEVQVRVQHDQSGNAMIVMLGQSAGTPDPDLMAVVVPATAAVAEDGEALNPVDRGASAAHRAPTLGDLVAGNTADVLAAQRTAHVDVDGDGRLDAVALFSLGKVEAIRAQSDELDGPVGLHYSNQFGETFLVPDLLALPRGELASPLGESIVDALGDELFRIDTAIETHASTPAAGAPAPAELDAALPVVTRLAGFRPNPFIRQTAVSFDLAKPGRVALDVYDLTGAKVRGLAGATFDGGRHAVTWDGRDDAGRRVPPGVYFVRFVADGVVNTGKALLLP